MMLTPPLHKPSRKIFTVSFAGLRAVVNSDSQEVAESLGHLFPGSSVPTAPHRVSKTVSYQVRELESVVFEHSEVYAVAKGDRGTLQAAAAGDVTAFLERSITMDAARYLGGRGGNLLVHAGALALNGRGILFPAPAGSGKSALAAAMTLSGFRFYSDEIGIIASNGLLRPFSKAITLESDGWKALAERFPGTKLHVYQRGTERKTRYILEPTRASRRVDSGESASGGVDLVIVPRYSPGARAVLEPLSGSRTVAALLSQSINLPHLGSHGVELLHRVAAGARCFSLAFDDLGEAVTAIREAID